MKHLKLFNSINSVNESLGIELPEGYQFNLLNPSDKEECKKYFEEGDTQDWSGLSFDEWFDGIQEMGEIQTPSGNSYFRGNISWPEMGIEYIYEIHPL